jgi:crotonobetainyl-CoA:carnitine CoA-transferase CaiB-like acyl-CoA transferase
MMAAPLCGMLLADHGADVIKIEMPGKGDDMRHWGHLKDGVGLAWKLYGRNKRSIELDLREPEGRATFLKLVASADVYIENFRPGTLDKWGLSGEVLRAAKPDLVVARISGFGQTGPKSARPGFGTLAEAMSGFAFVNGWPDRPPSLPSFGLADSIAGITAAYGVLAALHHRDRTGEGQDVDVSLYEPLLTVLGSLIVDYQQLGIEQHRSGNVLSFAAPRNAYATSDGHFVALSCGTQNTTQRLFEAIGRPELIDDERFATNAVRVTNAEALDAIVGEWFLTRTRAEALEVMERLGVTAGAVYSPADVFEDEHVRERGSIVPVDDDELGEIWMQAPIPRLTATPGSIRFAGRKEVGADNADVLGELERGLPARARP